MEEMKAKLATLEKDASKEDARKAVEEFKKDNEARFAAIKEAAGKVHEELKAKRPERKERPEPPAAVKAKIAEVKKVEKTLHVARKAVSEKLKEAQDELAAKIAQAKESADKGEVADNIKTLIAEQAAARKAALDEFRAAQKEKHEELKAAQKELRKEVRNTKEEGSSRTSR
jgi:chromosome segregation ATPase